MPTLQLSYLHKVVDRLTIFFPSHSELNQRADPELGIVLEYLRGINDNLGQKELLYQWCIYYARTGVAVSNLWYPFLRATCQVI